MLDQRWISGRFLVDCSDSELFFHASAWYDKFSDCIYVIQCLFLDDIHTFRCEGNCMLTLIEVAEAHSLASGGIGSDRGQNEKNLRRKS